MIRPLDERRKLIRREPLKHDRLSLQRRGFRRMTVCVAAVSSECIVCVADKALSYGDSIQWESDCIKIVDLRGQAIAMFASDREVHVTELAKHLWKIDDYILHRMALIKLIEEKFRDAYEQTRIDEILAPRMITTEMYQRAITRGKINSVLHEVAAEMKEHELLCDALFCGYDGQGDPYILHAAHAAYPRGGPPKITDLTGVGFHAIGVGTIKAVSQLLLVEHARNHDAARTLYECFDAKAHAETTPGVGEKWDACLVAADGAHVVNDEAKSLIAKVWADANRSPFDARPEPGHPSLPPENWQQELSEHVRECLKSQKETTWTVRTPTMIFRNVVALSQSSD